MSVQRIIRNVEERKHNSIEFLNEVQSIMDWITDFNIDTDLKSKEVRAKTGEDQENMYIMLRSGKCGLFHNGKLIELNSIRYFNIEDMSKAILSILKQMQTISTREKKLSEIKNVSKYLSEYNSGKGF